MIIPDRCKGIPTVRNPYRSLFRIPILAAIGNHTCRNDAFVVIVPKRCFSYFPSFPVESRRGRL